MRDPRKALNKIPEGRNLRDSTNGSRPEAGTPRPVTEFSRNLLEILSYSGLSQRELAAHLGINENHLSRLRHGKANPSARLKGSVTLLHRQILWESGAPAKDSSGQLEPGAQKGRWLPLIKWGPFASEIAAGNFASILLDWVPGWGLGVGCYAITIAEEAMEPLVCVGDLVFLDPSVAPKSGDIALVGVNDGSILIRRFYRSGKEGQCARLESAGESYATREMRLSELMFVHAAASLHRVWGPRR